MKITHEEYRRRREKAAKAMDALASKYVGTPKTEVNLELLRKDVDRVLNNLAIEGILFLRPRFDIRMDDVGYFVDFNQNDLNKCFGEIV